MQNALARHTTSHQECRDDRLAEVKGLGVALRGIVENIGMMVTVSDKVTSGNELVLEQLKGMWYFCFSIP